ncbi:hypothetical protein [Salinarimonas sp.]|uniref:hypothetical protein n=1 Tax=Salinarimonas sp. TaxID=2766526 RepID=UPI0032D968FE
MTTRARVPGLARTAIAVLALYGLVLGGLLSGVAGALALSAPANATVWCAIDGEMPAHAPGDPCWHACRVHAGPTGPALPPGPAASLPARDAAPVARAFVLAEAPRAAPARVSLGARAPPVSRSLA